jgi:hypothetical protein
LRRRREGGKRREKVQRAATRLHEEVPSLSE